jgi:hypothetical protein
MQRITLDFRERTAFESKVPSCGSQPAHIRVDQRRHDTLDNSTASPGHEAAATMTVAAAASPCPLDKPLPISESLCPDDGLEATMDIMAGRKRHSEEEIVTGARRCSRRMRSTDSRPRASPRTLTSH